MAGNIKWLFASAMLLFAGSAFAQGRGSNSLNINSAPQTEKPKPIKRPKPISKEMSFGLRVNSDGWGVFADKGWVRSDDKYSDLFYNVRVFQVEFAEKKHTKETKRTSTLPGFASDNPTPYIYGKVNNFYALKLGYGNRKLIAGKPEPGTVSVHWVYLGGLSAGLLKPYYVDAYVVDNTGSVVQKTIKYEESTKRDFLRNNYILGAAGFSQGLGEIQVVPGMHFKTALHFDFAAHRHSKLALETGVNVEFYTSNIQIMANQKDVPYFVNVYAAFQFGKRK